MLSGLDECSALNRSIDEVFNVNKMEFLGPCEAECLHPCQSVKYSTKNTILKSYGPDHKLSITNFQISVYDFSYLEITQVPKTNGFTFLSYVGGAMGLFMGLSFLSFIEVFELIIDVLLTAFAN